MMRRLALLFLFVVAHPVFAASIAGAPAMVDPAAPIVLAVRGGASVGDCYQIVPAADDYGSPIGSTSTT
jgi:hypothetical protein